MNDRYITLEDIGRIPLSMMPMMALTNGFTSVFGFLISLWLKDFWSHFMWLISPDEFASQWFWFKLFPVKNFTHHSIKLWYNPLWTETEKALLSAAIETELDKTRWQTRYDVIGVIGEAFKISWMNRKRLDFCSEKINILSKVDKKCQEWLIKNPSPIPEEVNAWLKDQMNEDGSHRYIVFGRVQPG